MIKETTQQRTSRILSQLQTKYPEKTVFDLDGRGMHFVCELEPTSDHPDYDRAIEVIISSLPHKHLETTQYYTVFSGDLALHLEDEIFLLHPGDKYTVSPNTVHWATSDNECWVELYSTPGWKKEDHIPVNG